MANPAPQARAGTGTRKPTPPIPHPCPWGWTEQTPGAEVGWKAQGKREVRRQEKKRERNKSLLCTGGEAQAAWHVQLPICLCIPSKDRCPHPGGPSPRGEKVTRSSCLGGGSWVIPQCLSLTPSPPPPHTRLCSPRSPKNPALKSHLKMWSVCTFSDTRRVLTLIRFSAGLP